MTPGWSGLWYGHKQPTFEASGKPPQRRGEEDGLVLQAARLTDDHDV